MTCSDYISVTNTRATARVACVREKKNRITLVEMNKHTSSTTTGFELTHVVLALGSRRLDQFDVFMSPRATVNSHATEGDADRCNLVMLT